MELKGEGFLVLIPRHAATGVPAPVRPLTGPLLVGAATYESIDIGPYLEVFTAELAQLHQHHGLCVTRMAVTTQISVDIGRKGWGFPKELAQISLDREGNRYRFTWEEEGIVISGYRMMPALAPVPPRLKALQIRDAAPVVVPTALSMTGSPGYAKLSAPDGSPLEHLRGRYPAFYLTGKLVLLDAQNP